MANPNGPYPGRQLFVGLTAAQQPCFAYLVTGRSPESRQRQAVQVGNTVRMGPIGDAPYDPLRHYSAVKFDDATGTLAVSNGIQTDAVYETYKLLVNVGSPCDAAYLQQIMEGANAEPDSYHTPRIAACIFPTESGDGLPRRHQGAGRPRDRLPGLPGAGSARGNLGLQGRHGSTRSQRTPMRASPRSQPRLPRPSDLATFLFDLSAAEYDGNDIRVCAVAGVWSGSAWELAIVNR